MLTEEEQAFINYWKMNREKQKRTFQTISARYSRCIAVRNTHCDKFFLRMV